MTEAPGYVLAWRSKWEHPIFRRKQEAAVWAWMCETAQWQDYRMATKFGPIELKRGELVIAERELAEDFGMHRNTLRALIQRMVDDGMIELFRDRTPHRAGTVVKVRNYEQYQQVEGRTFQSLDRKKTEDGTEAGPKEDRSGTKNKQEKQYKQQKEDSPARPVWADDAGLFDYPEPEPEAIAEQPKAKKPKAKPLFTPAEVDAFFTGFMEVFPSRDKPHSIKGAKRLFAAALKRKVDPAAIIAGATRYCQQTKIDRHFGTKYVKDAFNWLNESKWEDYNGVHHFPGSEKTQDGEYKFAGDKNNPPVGYDDAPTGTKKGWWCKTSRGWNRYAS